MAEYHIERTIGLLKQATRSIESQITIAHWLRENDFGPDSDGVTRSDIEDAIGDSLDHTVRTSVRHLVDMGLVEEFVERETTYVIAEWHPDVFIMGQVNEAATEGIEALIDDLEDMPTTEEEMAVIPDGAGRTLREVVANRFDLKPESVEDFLLDGDPVDLLNEAVEAIQESRDHEVGDGYGEITFRNPAYRYRLTEVGMELYML